MKKILTVLLFGLISTLSYADNIPACKDEKTNSFGFCKNESINKKDFIKLQYNTENKIFYGYKSVFIQKASDEAYKSYAFDKDGKQIFEIPGIIGDFSPGTASITYNEGFRFSNLGPKEILSNSDTLNKFKNYLKIDQAIFDTLLIINKLFMIEGTFYKTEFTKMDDNIKLGYINTKGEIIIKPIYKKFVRPHNFSNQFNYGIVNIEDGKYGVINKSGEYLVNMDYDKIYLYDKNLVLYKEDCGFFICNGTKTYLDDKTLKELDKKETKRYKHDLVNYIINGKADTPEKQITLLFTLACILSVILIPFCVLYQKYKKKLSLQKSFLKGIMWSFIIGFVSVIGTILALILLVFVFFGANMFATIALQDEKN